VTKGGSMWTTQPCLQDSDQGGQHVDHTALSEVLTMSCTDNEQAEGFKSHYWKDLPSLPTNAKACDAAEIEDILQHGR